MKSAGTERESTSNNVDRAGHSTKIERRLVFALLCLMLLVQAFLFGWLRDWWRTICYIIDPKMPPWNADPREAAARAVVKPLAEHIWWNDEGRIQGIDLVGVNVTPHVSAAIAQLDDLEQLCLWGAQLTDEDLRALNKLTKLGAISLGYTNVTDRGVAYLMEISSLTLIDLQHTRVTDKGLEILATNRNLKYVFLEGCQNITIEGVRRLRAALGPDAVVSSDFSKSELRLEHAESQNLPRP